MAIEINGERASLATNVNEGSNKTSAQNDPNAKSATTGDQSPVPGDSVNLTNTVSMLKKMEASLQNVPVVDEKRVASVKQSILNGSFNIDPSRIAEKMLNLESMLKGG
jgi:negative regulator of flagellin synthesis FlgM